MRRNKRVSSLLNKITDTSSSPSCSGSKNESNGKENECVEEGDGFSISIDSSSSIKTPNFFDSFSTPRRCLLPAFEEEVEKKLLEDSEINRRSLPVEDTAKVTSENICNPQNAVKDVRVFIDVSGAFDKETLQESLQNLGATVCSKFGKNVTHLIFWNGLQDILDKAHLNGYCPLIIAPHWVERCAKEGKFVDESPYFLYGLNGLALSHVEMARGRVGRIEGSATVKKRSAISSALKRSSSKRSCNRTRKQHFTEQSLDELDSGSPIDSSTIMYTIEALSDELAPALASLENSGISIHDVMTPLFERIKKRVNELSKSRIMMTPCISEDFPHADHKVIKKTRINASSKRSPPIFGSPEDSSGKMPRHPLGEEHSSDSTNGLNDQNLLQPEAYATSQSAPANPSKQKKTCLRAAQIKTRGSSVSQERGDREQASAADLTRSEPAKRRGRPWIPAEQMTPLQFEKAVWRRYPKSYRSHLKMNEEEKAAAYQQYLDREIEEQSQAQSKTTKEIQKPRPVAVRTRSKVLNDLQVVNSSEEFVRSRSRVRHVPRKPGNIVLSAIEESDREFLYAIVRRLGILRVTKNVDEETRFVIGDDAGSRTLNVMHAIVNGFPVVSKEWAYRSLDNMSWLNAQEFLLPKWKAVYKAYRKGRLQQLFSSLGPFYISNHCSPPADHLGCFIEKCGGKVTESLSRASIFIAPREFWEGLVSRHRNNQDVVHTLPERWVLDSITCVKVCAFEEYQKQTTNTAEIQPLDASRVQEDVSRQSETRQNESSDCLEDERIDSLVKDLE